MGRRCPTLAICFCLISHLIASQLRETEEVKGVDNINNNYDSKNASLNLTSIDPSKIIREIRELPPPALRPQSQQILFQSPRTLPRFPHDCHSSLFGCCEDELTPAMGPGYKGCGILKRNSRSCFDTVYGCCEDQITAAKGSMQQGCPENIWKEIDDRQLMNIDGIRDKVKLEDAFRKSKILKEDPEIYQGKDERMDLKAFEDLKDDPRTPYWYGVQ